MTTAEEFLKQDVGAKLMDCLCQIALLKAEIERLREDIQRREAVAADRDGHLTPHP
jgi:uncharacterized small protein (DUF1192 family)